MGTPGGKHTSSFPPEPPVSFVTMPTKLPEATLSLHHKFRQDTESPAVVRERLHTWPGVGQVRGGSGRHREGLPPRQRCAEFSVQPRCRVPGSECGDAEG